MRPTPSPTLAVLLATAPGALAWGPLSHSLVNQRALALLPAHPAAAWLAERSAADAFVRSAQAADLTFRIAAGGKTDPALNALLHAPEFAAYLAGRAAARGPRARAVALGILGHQVGDLTGNTPDAPT